MVERSNMDFIQKVVVNFHDGYYLEDDRELISFYMRHIYSHLLRTYGPFNLNQDEASYMYEKIYLNKGNIDYDDCEILNPRSSNMNNLIDFIEDFHHIQISFA